MKCSTQFLRDLEKSRMAVNEFACRASSPGISLWLPPERTRPSASERRLYSDSCDITVQARVEHKVRDLDFTCRNDYPFDTVFVDEVYNHDQKGGSPLMYVIQNRRLTHAAVVYGWTRPEWTVETRFDAAQDRECRFYAIHKTKVRFCAVENVFTA